MNDDLEKRVWPKSPLKEEHLDAGQLKQFLAIRADYEKSAFVQEGHFEVRALGAKEFTRPIPPGEAGICALLSHSNGRIYGGTKGSRAHLFFYNPAPDADAVADLGVLPGMTGVTAMVEMADQSVAVAAGDGSGRGKIFYYRPCEVLLRDRDFTGMGVREIFDFPAEDQMFFSTVDPCHSGGEVVESGLPVPDESIADLATAGGRLWMIGGESGRIYSVDPGGAEPELEMVFRLDPNGNFSRRFGRDAAGNLLAAGLYGRLFRLDAERGVWIDSGSCAPALKGRELYNRVTAFTLEPRSGVVYGGTIDGIIFRIDPESGRVVSLGKPTDQSNVVALAATGGRIYALLGLESDCARLGVYAPEDGEMRDLGCILARSERPWNGYNFGAMIRGRGGVLFMGECDRISHLFIYYPPVERENRL